MKDFEIIDESNYTIITILSDKLDLHIAPLLKTELVIISGTTDKNIILDISNCRYCDSAGLAIMLSGNRLCKKNKTTFVVTGLNDLVKKLFHVSQLEPVIKIADSIEDAINIIENDI